MRPVEHLANRPRLLGVLVLIALAGIGYVIVLSVNGVPFQKRYRVTVEVPSETPPLKVADQVRIAGQRAGIIMGTTPRRDHAEVELEINPRFWPLGTATRARVRVRLGSGLTWVELQPAGPGRLAEGATIPRERVAANSTLPQAAEAFDASTRRSLARGVETAGAAVLGQGAAMNASVADLRAVVTEGLPLLEALTPAPGDVARLVQGTRRLVGGLAASAPQLPGLVTNARRVTEAVAAADHDLAALVDAAPGLERRLIAVGPGTARLLDRTIALTGELTPAFGDVAAALPSLRRALVLSPELRAATRQLSGPVRLLLRDAVPALRTIRAPILMIKPLTDAIGPVGTLLTSYKADMLAGVKGLEAVTTTRYREGATAPGAAALRFAPVLYCHPSRNPYPAPGQAMNDRSSEGLCP